MHLFPESGFDQSAITPVFLGVLVSWFFTETLGWVFVGLVVPGYLATLFLLDPRSAAIDVAEAALTYGAARVVCEHLSHTGLTSRMFGRERFLAVLVVSVLVRLGVEGMLIPAALPHARWAYSIGLVIVPLAANACWKTGLLRGAVQNGVTTLIVYVLLRCVLVAHTNLSLAGFHLSIENVASSFLRSPHAYFVLLTGALIAAAANVRYGWDYGGILLPALIALVVATPIKLAATFAEAGVLVAVVAGLLRVTPLGSYNIEGPRRPVLFMTVDYVLRFGAAALFGRHLPGTELVELTGLGYLLPSLLAVKVSQKTSAALIFLPTVSVSLLAFGATATVTALISAVGGDALASKGEVSRHVGVAPGQPMLAALWVSALARPAPEREHGNAALRGTNIARAALGFARGQRPHYEGLEMQPLAGSVVLLRERFAELEKRQGTPAVLVSTLPLTHPRRVALVSAPLAGPQCAALAGHWLERGSIDALVIAGTEKSHKRDLEPDAALQVARALADADEHRGIVIGVRGATTQCAAHTGRVSAAAHEFLRADRELSSCEASTDAARVGEDLSLEVPTAAADDWMLAREATPSFATSSALALSLADLRSNGVPATLEDSLVLRRLVLEPLLALRAPSCSLALSAAAATALGYRLLGPATLPGGEQGLALVPQASGGQLALVARLGGARGLVIEAPHAGNVALRSLALRLQAPLHADAVILGLEAGQGALGNAEFAEAHALASWPSDDRASAVLTLHEGGDGPSVGVGVWGSDEAAALAAALGQVFEAAGVAWSTRSVTVATRNQAARAGFEDTPFVSATLSAALLAGPMFSTDTLWLRELRELPLQDGEGAAALEGLLKQLPDHGPEAPLSLLDTGGRVAAEHSVVALRTLLGLVATTATRAVVIRANSGVYLAVAGRLHQRVALGLYPLLFVQLPAQLPTRAAPTAAVCLLQVARGGTCVAELAK